MPLVPLGLIQLRHRKPVHRTAVSPAYILSQDTCRRHPYILSRLPSKVMWRLRFTLDELEGFLETAKECIPGVKEAIVSANSHKAHRVRILCLPRLL